MASVVYQCSQNRVVTHQGQTFNVSSSSKVAIVFFSKKKKLGVVSTTNFLRDLLSRRCLLSLHSVSYHAVHPTARHGIPKWLHVKERMCDIANSGVDQLVEI